MATVLVLEDEPLVLGLIRAILEPTRRDILIVKTCDEALRAAREHTIDLLIADVILRDGKGPDAARRLLAINPHMRCLLISGYPREQLEDAHLLDAGRLGTDGVAFLQKPFTPAELRLACDWLLQPKRQQTEGAGKVRRRAASG